MKYLPIVIFSSNKNLSNILLDDEHLGFHDFFTFLKKITEFKFYCTSTTKSNGTENCMFSSFFDLLIKTFYSQQKFVRHDLRLSTSQTGRALTDKVINYWAISLTVEKRGLRRRQLATLWQYQLRTENYLVTNAL